MARLRRRWRMMKWAGVLAAALLLAALVGSLRWGISYSKGTHAVRTNRKGNIFYDVERLHYFNLCDAALYYSYSPKTQAVSMLNGLEVDAKSPHAMTWKPTYHSDPTLFGFGLPLWMPLMLVLVPTTMLFYLDRRRIPPHCCQHCGYDLMGNVSGSCSECGAKA